mmetsp:Transcript_61341/g.91121  ORF Transcript_61341/g.91121 Transcript_61341/m.91121 type:complete len:529 (-) Transcript_61341:349-1935(-)
MANFTEWLNAERWDLIRDYLLGRRRTVAWVDQGDADEVSDAQLMEACKRASLPEDILSLIFQKVDLNRSFPFPSFAERNGLERKETALHVAAEGGSETTVKFLLNELGPQRRQKEVFREDMEGKTVMDRLWISFVTKHMTQLQSITNFQTLMYNSIVAELWNKTTLLLLAARPSRLNHVLLDGAQFTAVHAILSHGATARAAITTSTTEDSDTTYSNIIRSCPSILLHLALNLYPHQPKHPDERGFYPLHLAILNPTHHALHPSILPPHAPSSHASLLQDANIIPPLQLLQRYPQAASIPHPNTGQYPLHLALQSYHAYHTLHHSRFGTQSRSLSWMHNRHVGSSSSSSFVSSNDSSSSSASSSHVLHHHPTPWDDLIIQLISLHPPALTIPDKQIPPSEDTSSSSKNNNTTTNKNLLPFFMAASIPTINVTTLFTILRSHPCILQNVITTTRQERYLTKKVFKLKRERDSMEVMIRELQAKVAKLESQQDVKQQQQHPPQDDSDKEQKVRAKEAPTSLNNVKSNSDN